MPQQFNGTSFFPDNKIKGIHLKVVSSSTSCCHKHVCKHGSSDKYRTIHLGITTFNGLYFDNDTCKKLTLNVRIVSL